MMILLTFFGIMLSFNTETKLQKEGSSGFMSTYFILTAIDVLLIMTITAILKVFILKTCVSNKNNKVWYYGCSVIFFKLLDL